MTGRQLEGQYAGFLSRAAGLILDYVILIATVLVTALLAVLLFSAFGMNLAACPDPTAPVSVGELACVGGQLVLIVWAMLIGPVYFVLFWMLVGQTIGQRVMGLRVTRLDGHRVGFRSSLLRWLGYQFCIATFGIGFLWVLIDDRRMGWHDKLGRTCVIYSWKAVQNERFLEKMNRRLRRQHDAPPVETDQAAQAESGLASGNPAVQEQLPG